MTLEREDFCTLGEWCRTAPAPVAAALEGGYSDDLPELVEAYLRGWGWK
jgi:acetoin utilization deacetylase AcuC-like enzyme